MKRLALVVYNDIMRVGLERSLAPPEHGINLVGLAKNHSELIRLGIPTPEVLLYWTDDKLADSFEPVAAMRKFFRRPLFATLCLCPSFMRRELPMALEIGIRGILKTTATLPDILAALKLLPKHQIVDTSIMIPDQILDHNLTPREKQVGLLLGTGLKVKDIAGQLILSVKTVEAHKFNLMRKLDIHSTAQLISHFIVNYDGVSLLEDE